MTRLPLPLLLAGLALFYIGERVLDGLPRTVLSTAGGVVLVVAVVLACLRWLGAEGRGRQAHGWLFAAYGLVGASILLYLIQSDWLAWVSDGDGYAIAQIAWPILLALGAAPAITIEMALRSMRGAPTVEIARVSRAARAALVVALGLVTFGSINYVSARWNKKVDLSYFKVTEPSESTKALVKTLAEPIDVFLFYPAGNEVLGRLQDYLAELTPLSASLVVREVDQVLEPALARELKVNGNGFLVVRRGTNVEKLSVKDELAGARTTLRKLDQEFQERLVRVVRPDRIAYFTSGHLERGFSPSGDDKRLPVSELRSLLENQGFEIKNLGLAEGLGNEVPTDATLVVVAGPTEALLESERESLFDYLRRGGNLLYAVEPDHGAPDVEMLQGLGLAMSTGLVASESPQSQVRIPGTALSPYNLATTQTVVHPVTNTFRATTQRLAYVVLGAGALTKSDTAPKGVMAKLIMRTESQAFVDANGDQKRQDDEPEAVQYLVSAVAVQGDDTTGHALVISDVDAVGNGILRNPGNAFVIVDGVRWMTGDEAIAKGAPTTEEDVKILHRKDEDKVWFYGTTVASPAIVLAFGLLYTRRRRRIHS